MKTREIAKKLEQAGFIGRAGKKHVKYKHPDGRWTVISKGCHELDIDLIREMEKQAGISLR